MMAPESPLTQTTAQLPATVTPGTVSGFRRVFLPAAKHALIEDFDRILFLAGATVAGIAEHAWPFRVGAVVIALMVGPKLVGSYRRAVKLYREKHLPVVLGLGCSDEEFRNLIEDAFQAARPYGFDEALYAKDYSLLRQDVSHHREEAIPDDAEVWKQLCLKEKRLVINLQTKIAGKKLFHFFLRCPNALAIGIGAAIGTKHELVCHHYQPGAGGTDYFPLIELSPRMTQGEGPRALKTKVAGFQYIVVQGQEQAKGKVYVALGLAAHSPNSAQTNAVDDSASFVEITSKFGRTIPLDADWLLLAREINTVLLGLIERRDVNEVHLFPAMPVCLAFAVGMGLDNRSAFVVHAWNGILGQYKEVLRLNELRD